MAFFDDAWNCGKDKEAEERAAALERPGEAGLHFRPGKEEDLPELGAMVRRAVAQMEEQHIFQWDEQYPDAQTLERDVRSGELSVGTYQGRIVCFYVLNRNCDREYEAGKWKYPHIPYYILHRLCVDPAVQGQGLGKRTMEEVERQVISLGAGALRLDAFMENSHALGLYGKLGYETVGFVQWRKGRFCLMEKYLDGKNRSQGEEPQGRQRPDEKAWQERGAKRE